MEPRWKAKEWADDGSTYLGGTNEFDLWIDEDKHVRVAWGTAINEWDYFIWSRSEETYDWCSHDKEFVDHDEVLGESLTYIRIFAPWVEEELKNKGLRNDEDNG